MYCLWKAHPPLYRPASGTLCASPSCAHVPIKPPWDNCAHKTSMVAPVTAGDIQVNGT